MRPKGPCPSFHGLSWTPCIWIDVCVFVTLLLDVPGHLFGTLQNQCKLETFRNSEDCFLGLAISQGILLPPDLPRNLCSDPLEVGAKYTNFKCLHKPFAPNLFSTAARYSLHESNLEKIQLYTWDNLGLTRTQNSNRLATLCCEIWPHRLIGHVISLSLWK